MSEETLDKLGINLNGMFEEILESPEYKDAMSKAVDECKANCLLMTNDHKELMNRGLSLEHAKEIIENSKDIGKEKVLNFFEDKPKWWQFFDKWEWSIIILSGMVLVGVILGAIFYP